MADSHPYISGAGNIAKMVNHLRESFPATVTSDTIKKLGIAPNNESYVINILQYIGVLDDAGKKTDEGAKVFSQHQDKAFASEFSKLIKKAYSDLFELRGDASWSLDDDALITFFRQSDQTGATIGKRQASTFKVLAALSGHGELPTSRSAVKTTSNKAPKKARSQSTKTKKSAAKSSDPSQGLKFEHSSHGKLDFGLTVRVEINLPADGSRATYDNIFKSIKENLLEG